MPDLDVPPAGALSNSRTRAPEPDSCDAVCGVDAEGRVLFTNAEMLRLMQREDEDLTDRSLHDLVHRDPAGREAHAAQACPFRLGSSAPTSGIDSGFTRGDGSSIDVGYVVLAYDEGSAHGAVISVRDLTGRGPTVHAVHSRLTPLPALGAQRGALREHLAAAQERERLRIAADIHDDTIQALGAVALRLSHAGERAATDAVRDVLSEAEIEIRSVTERLRRLVFALMPPDSGDDLRGTVETFCSTLFAESAMSCEIVGEVGELAPEDRLVAYRLVQEALRNALAHSHGSRVRVEMRRERDELLITISDDGVGRSNSPAPPTHAGLRIVRERAEAAGGSARFGVGLDGRGCSVSLRLALDGGAALDEGEAR